MHDGNYYVRIPPIEQHHHHHHHPKSACVSLHTTHLFPFGYALTAYRLGAKWFPWNIQRNAEHSLSEYPGNPLYHL